MRVYAGYPDHLPQLLDQWAEDIDRLAGEIRPQTAFKETPPGPRHDPPRFSPPLELWAEAVDRLLAGRVR